MDYAGEKRFFFTGNVSGLRIAGFSSSNLYTGLCRSAGGTGRAGYAMKYALAYGKSQLEFSLPEGVKPLTVVPGSKKGLADPIKEMEAMLKKEIGHIKAAIHENDLALISSRIEDLTPLLE